MILGVQQTPLIIDTKNLPFRFRFVCVELVHNISFDCHILLPCFVFIIEKWGTDAFSSLFMLDVTT